MPAKISIIIPYYNGGQYLHAAVQSALASYSGPLEIIVVNDGSLESNAQAYLNNAKRLSPDVRIVTKNNGGLSSARNAGLDACTGDFIQFLDVDDALFPGKLDLQIQHLAMRSDVVCSITNYCMADEWMTKFDATYDSIGRFPLNAESVLFLWERGFSIAVHAALFRREVFADLRFNEDLPGKEDWVMWASLFRAAPRGLGYLPLVKAAYRTHGASMTRGYEKMGRAWLTAAGLLNTVWGDEFPHFLAASRRWHSEFYVKNARWAKIQEQLNGGAETSPIPISTANVGDTDGLLTRAETIIRGPPRASNAGSRPPRLSIVIPAFNHYDHLASCLDSVTGMGPEIEVIVYDDASPDPRVEPYLRTRAETMSGMTYIRGPKNVGISCAQNRAVSMASGDYVAFLDCDDYLLEGAVKTLLRLIEVEPADYYFTDRLDVDEHGQTIRVAKYGGYDWIDPSGSVRDDLVLGMVASHWKVMRRSLYLQAGGSSEEFSGIQDWELALRVADKASFTYIPQPLYAHRQHANSVTASASTTQFWMTNCVRRTYVETTYPVRKRTGALAIEFLRDFQDVRAAVAKRLRGVRLRFDASSRALGPTEIGMLREFNSLFDEIILGDFDATALMGYLWDHNVLKTRSAIIP